MEDPENKTEVVQEIPKVSEEKEEPAFKFQKSKDGCTELAVRNKDGTIRIAQKNAEGKFVSTKHLKKPMPDSREVTKYFRELLLMPEAGPNGKITKGSKSRIRRMFDNMVEIATMSPDTVLLDMKGQPLFVDGKPLTVKDAKMASASAKAFEILMARSYGKVAPGDEELDAMKVAGIKVIVVSPPMELSSKKTEEDKPREEAKPSWIEGEIVSTNEKAQ